LLDRGTVRSPKEAATVDQREDRSKTSINELLRD
jgi:hypothetical protein